MSATVLPADWVHYNPAPERPVSVPSGNDLDWHQMLCDFADAAHTEWYPQCSDCRKMIREHHRKWLHGDVPEGCPHGCCTWDCRYAIDDGECECTHGLPDDEITKERQNFFDCTC